MIATINGEGASPEGGTLLSLPDPTHGAVSLLAVWNSFAFDFVARQKVGGTHLKYFTMRQLPMPAPDQLMDRPAWQDGSWNEWFAVRVLALLLDSDDMAALGADFGVSRSPGIWDSELRRRLRAELDAAVFHLFGIARDDVDYIMDTFPIVKRKDVAAFGSYRTKELILAAYDAMQVAMDAGTRYVSSLDTEFAGQGED